MAEPRARTIEQSEVVNAKGGSPGEERQAVGAKDDSPSGNRQGEAMVVSLVRPVSGEATSKERQAVGLVRPRTS